MRRIEGAVRASTLAVVFAAAAAITNLSAARADDVTPQRLLNADKEPGNWLHHHKNYSATRFSSLKDINKDNVKNLKVAWTMHLGGVEGGGDRGRGGGQAAADHPRRAGALFELPDAAQFEYLVHLRRHPRLLLGCADCHRHRAGDALHGGHAARV